MENKDLNNLETDTLEEKESTKELREAYEEGVDDRMPAEKKKKWSKKKIALVSVAGFLVLVIVAVGLFFLIGSLLAKTYTVVQGDYKNKAPQKESTYTAADNSAIEKVLDGTATDDEIKELFAMMYNKANQNKINAPQAITVLQGMGSASVEIMGAKPSGSMVVRGIKVQAGDACYYQKAAPLVECSVDSLQKILKNTLDQQERAYTDGVSDYRLTYNNKEDNPSSALKGSAAKILLDDDDNPMTTTVPFVPVGVPAAENLKSFSKEEFYKIGHYLEDPREITNFRVKKEYIVLNELGKDEDGKDIKRFEICQTPDGDVYYVCRFSLLIDENDPAHDDCVEISRDYLRKSADSKNLEYKRFDIQLEVWENGYFKMFHDEEKWAGTAAIANTSTESESWYESVTYYDFAPELFTEEDAKEYEGEDWASKIIAHYLAELNTAQ